MITATSSLRRRAVVFKFAVLASAIAPCSAHATSLFWDSNSSQAGTGTWDTTNTTVNWKTTSGNGAPNSTWNPNDGTVDAFFNGNAGTNGASGTVTLASGATANVNSIVFQNTAGNFLVGGTLAGSHGVINIASATSSIVMQTNQTSTNGDSINASITGTDITVMNNGSSGNRSLLNLNVANQFTGSLILGGTAAATSFSNSNQVALGNANSLGGPTNMNDVKFMRNYSNLLFTSGGNGGAGLYTATYANNIDLNATGSTGANGFTAGIGGAVSGTVITLTGVIKSTGDADLVFTNGLSGGQAKIILANHETYTGSTTMQLASTGSQSGIVALGIDDALPKGTALMLGNSAGAPSGTFDLSGHNQTIGSLETGSLFITSGTTKGNAQFLSGITNTNSSTSTLTIKGSASTTYAGALGAAVTTAVIGSNDNIALKLDAANTGTLLLLGKGTTADGTVVTAYNGVTYNGGTDVEGGTLVVGNTQGSGTGSGAVNVGSNGTLASAVINLVPASGTTQTVSGGIITGSVTTAGTTNPGGIGTAGTMTLSGGLTANSGAKFNFDFGSSFDQIALGSSSLSLATDPNALTLNLSDLTGTAFTNGQSYTIFTGSNLAGTNVSGFKINPPISGTANFANFSLTTDANGVELTATGVGSFKTWAGGVSGTWDMNNTQSFNNGAAVSFGAGDVATFDDTNGSDSVVNIATGGVNPGNTVINGTHNYTFNGSINSGGLTVNTTGTVVLTGSNSYAAGTTVAAGTLEIAGDSSLGAVPSSPTVNLTIAKTAASTGTLKFDGNTTLNANRILLLTQANGGGPSFDTNGHNVTIAGQITTSTTGGVNLVKFGNGVLTLLADNSGNAAGGFVNAVLINGGAVNVSQDVSLGKTGSAITLNGGALQFGASFNTPRPIVLGANGAIVDTNSFDATISGNVTASAGTNAAFTKMGGGTLTLTGTNTFAGALNVAGGTLAAANTNINGATSINLSAGGTLKNTGNMTIAQDLSIASTGGSLDGGTNGITVNGTGATTLNGSATIAAGTVTFNRSGGTVTVGTGGALTVNSGATLNLQGTAVTSAGGNNTLINNNGVVNVSSNHTISAIRGSGSLAVSGGSTLTVAAGGGNTGTSVLGALSIDATSALNLNDHSLIVNYSGSSPISTIRGYLHSGYNAGAWNGPGINSSVASADSTQQTAIGYAEASDLGKTNGSFAGQSVGASAVLVKYTYYGDNNLDGVVNLDDFSIFVDGINGLGSGWLYGDYDYSGTIDQADFAMFVKGYNNSGSNPPLSQLILSDSSLSDSQKSALLSVVPEPTSLGIVTIAAGAMAMRRRRRA